MTTGNDLLAEHFEQARPRLRSVAYRMLGSLGEAEDAVQESWVRLSRSDADAIDNLDAWLTTVVGRVCLNMLRARQTRREESIDVVDYVNYVPDPIVEGGGGAGAGGRLGEGGAAARSATRVPEPCRAVSQPSATSSA